MSRTLCMDDVLPRWPRHGLISDLSLEIIFDLRFGFPINNIISLELIRYKSDNRSHPTGLISRVRFPWWSRYIYVQPIPLGVTFSKALSKAQSSKLERLFSLKRGKSDVRVLSFELSKMSPQVGLAVSRPGLIRDKSGISPSRGHLGSTYKSNGLTTYMYLDHLISDKSGSRYRV